tara:strand:- start:209 stop:724 length:516 start_codon:yes stop_codon:yes gene_type:complete
MKANVLFILLLVSILPLKSQTFTEEGEVQKVLKGEKMDPTILASFGITTDINPRNNEINGNSVFLSQIGELNEVNIFTNTRSSEIKISQNGDFNKTDLNYTANTVVTELVQFGNYNLIQDFVNDPREDISLDLIQDGDYLNFQREGVNELTKSLKFRQTEASPSIIIRSYN